MVPSFYRVRRTFAAEDLNIKGLIGRGWHE